MSIKKIAFPLMFAVALLFVWSSAVVAVDAEVAAELEPVQLEDWFLAAVAPDYAQDDCNPDAADGDADACFVGCTKQLATSGIGSTCSCSATGAGATCVAAGQGNGRTITCTDGPGAGGGAITCSYTNNGSQCACA